MALKQPCIANGHRMIDTHSHSIFIPFFVIYFKVHNKQKSFLMPINSETFPFSGNTCQLFPYRGSSCGNNLFLVC